MVSLVLGAKDREKGTAKNYMYIGHGTQSKLHDTCIILYRHAYMPYSILASVRLFGGCGKYAEKALSTADVYQHDIQL